MSILGSIVGGVISSHAATNAANAQVEAAQAASKGVSTAAQNAQDAINRDVPVANSLLQGAYDSSTANLQPYQQAGASAAGMLEQGIQAGGDLNSPFKFTEDPGYQFRVQQGQQSIDRSAAARGGLMSGRAVKEGASFNSGLASQEYGAAFDRFNTNRTFRQNSLMGVAGLGQTANGQQIQAGSAFVNPQAQNILQGTEYSGNMGMEGARTAGDFWTQGANARASGYIGAGKAWNSASNGVDNQLTRVLAGG